MIDQKTETFHYDGLDVTVAQADIRRGMMRTRLRSQAAEYKDDDPDLRLLRLFTYPDVMAGTVSIMFDPDAEPEQIDRWQQIIEVWPPPFEQFARLPEPLGIAWENAVYRCNPHWLPGEEANPQGEARGAGA